ncbi:hypothetical protein QQ045_016752 [Rhodiola kirilowii]
MKFFYVILLIVLTLSSLLIIAEARTRIHIIYLGHTTHSDPQAVEDSHHDLLSSVVGSKKLAQELMVYNYKHGFSGFAAKLTEAQAQRLAEMPEVVAVIPNTIYKLQTTRSWDYLGLSTSPTDSNLLHDSKMGDGIIIGVFDSGVWPESKSFDDEGLGPIPDSLSEYRWMEQNVLPHRQLKPVNPTRFRQEWHLVGPCFGFSLPWSFGVSRCCRCQNDGLVYISLNSCSVLLDDLSNVGSTATHQG